MGTRRPLASGEKNPGGVNEKDRCGLDWPGAGAPGVGFQADARGDMSGDRVLLNFRMYSHFIAQAR